MQSEKMNPRLLITLTLMLLSQSVLLAVSPLVTDDADTVEAGKLQLNCDFFCCADEFNLVVFCADQPGPGPDSSTRTRRHIRLSVARWLRADPNQRRCRRPNGSNGRAKVSTVGRTERQAQIQRAPDLKLPTVSDRHGLGTGDPDVGLVGIATYKLGKTSFDSNIGYYAIDISRADFDNDRWFIGEAVRHELSKEWTVVAEAYALLPNTRAGGHATWNFSGGPQWNVRENIVVTALIGTAAGHKSPDLTGTFEITLTF